MMSSYFNDANDSPGFLLWQVTTIWQKRIREALEPFDLTHPQFVLLYSCYWLHQEAKRDDVTQVQLAQHTKVDVNVTSQVLRALQKRGLINRRPHPTDTRANLITVTREGILLAMRADSAVEEADRTFFSVLDNADRHEMVRFMLELLSH
ncbi:MarR family transcriptional regulator [Alicyclobacillaceae bacterium I2511]|jgi:DNA-binding MarR family transcriptional regulator|nr:MarR family transcriptional regulator [Alicyclobacillaceae bacterium I2511]